MHELFGFCRHFIFCVFSNSAAYKLRHESMDILSKRYVLVFVAAAQKKTLHVVVIDPEVVFVANLMKADAPALVASFQCDFSLRSNEADQVIKVNLKSFKILACPFIRNKDSKAVTTVNMLFFVYP